MRLSPFSSSCALLLGLVACSEGRSNDLPPPEEALSLNSVVTEQARASCQVLFNCPQDSPSQREVRLIFENPGRCQEYLLNLGAFDTGDLARAVEAGLLLYDGVAAKRCLALSAQTCDPLASDALLEACGAVFVGTVAVGGDCQRSEECAGATYCAKTSTVAGPVCPGRCTAQRPQGAECNVDYQCDRAGLAGPAVCTPTDEGPAGFVGRCRERKVAAPAAAGQPCGFDQPTATNTPCAEGLVCGRDPRVCVAPLARGAPCSPGSAVCSGTDTCRPEVPGGESVCGPIQLINTAGGSCASPATLCNPLRRLTCESDTCAVTRPPGGAEGNECWRYAYPVPCNRGLYCATEDEPSVCAPKLTLGETCYADAACLDGRCERGRCVARDCQARFN